MKNKRTTILVSKQKYPCTFWQNIYLAKLPRISYRSFFCVFTSLQGSFLGCGLSTLGYYFRFILAIVLGLWILGFGTSNFTLAQPANDNCSSATTLTVDAACINGTTVDATAQAGELGGCGGGDQSVWYKFVATNDSMQVTVKNLLTGGCYLSSAVWNGSGGCLPIAGDLLKCRPATAVGGAIQGHSVTPLTVGNTYYVQVIYSSGGPCNAGQTFCVNVTGTINNDECQFATKASAGTVYNSTNTTYSPDKDLCSGTTENNMWFYWIVPADWKLGDTAYVHLFNQNCNNADGMQMSVFDADNCGLIPDPAGAGDCVFYSNTQTTNDIFYKFVPSALGNIYYFDLDGFGGALCTFDFLIAKTQCLTIATTSTTQASCGGSNGTATFNATNSTPPYTFKWTNPVSVTSTTTSSTNSGLAAGWYTVTIIDALGCKITDTVRVVGPVLADFTFKGDSCLATNSITFTNTGTAPGTCGMGCPTFSWNFGDATTSTATNPIKTYAAAGTYNVRLIVNDGTCQDTVIIPVTIIDCNCPVIVGAGNDTTICSTATMTLKGSYSNANCGGCAGGVVACCGTINASTTLEYSGYTTIGNGTAGYIKICLNTNSLGTAMCGANSEQIVIRNASNSIRAQWFSTTATGTCVTINLADGYARISKLCFSAGADATLSWTTVDAAGNPIAGCSGANPLCPTKAWTSTTGLSSSTILNPIFTPSGTGTFTKTLSITDAICTKTDAVTITVITCGCPAISVAMVGTNLLCNGVCIGAATGTGSGGAAPYTYKWASGQTTQTISSLCAGTYTVTAKDANNCKGFSSVTITQPAPLTAVFTKGVATCATCICKNWALFNVTGGTLPRTYIWSDGYTYRYQNELCPGTFTASVTDVNGCKAGATVTVP